MPSSRASLVTALGAALLGAAAPAGAQSSDRLAAVDRYIEAERVRQHIPGVSAAVLRGGRVLLARGYGFASLEHRVRATDSTVYQSGSVGKQFTAALIQLLAAEGRLGLDDPIRRYVPGPRSWDRITIRHLLTHTSGIPDYADSTLDYRRDYTEDDLVRLAATLPVEFPPGEHWHYSNTGYLLLGAIVRKVTGHFYGEELHRRIFGPLGMRSTRIITERDIVPNRSDGYVLDDDGGPAHQDWVAPSINTTADGSLYFTIGDLVRWARALDGGPIPGRELLAAAWTPVRLKGGGSYPYGFGWELGQQRGHPRVGHGGSWQGFRTAIQRYPEYGITVIVLANLAEAEPEAIAYAVAGMLEPALAAPHVSPAAGGGAAPPRPIPELLRALADSVPGAGNAALEEFLLPDTRRSMGALLEPGATWTAQGCDEVAAKSVERLGRRVARVCYARATGGTAGHLVEVSYTDDGEPAFVDWYDF